MSRRERRTKAGRRFAGACRVRRVAWWVRRAAWSVGLVCLAPAVAPAQQAPVAATDSTRVCWRGEPLPTCSSFWLVELQASTTLVAPRYQLSGGAFPRVIDESGALYEAAVGHMLNLDPRWAIGGTATLGFGQGDPFTGARVRMRRWVGNEASLEFEAGIVRYAGDHQVRYPSSPQTGASAGLRLNIRDQGAAWVRYDGFGALSPDSVGLLPWGPGQELELTGGARHFVRAGVGLGSTPTLIAVGAIGLGYAVLWGLYLLAGGSS